MNVYNLAEMKEDEVRRLIETHEGRLCGRLARRRDGTFTVGACPRSLRRLGRQVAKLGGVVAGVISLFGCAWWTNAATGSADPPAKSIGDVITSWGEEPMEFLLGDIEIALPPPPTQGSGPGPSPPGDSV
ncbi:MAG: hypothetical protein QGG36_30825 [Pirellulaceae bacterium]|jgi:hypothetical protein|nr:hypothetical protein [Pirellulaceae bacterium]MDP7020232.1 hypothetical protein [Pirellulaceae bacterium]